MRKEPIWAQTPLILIFGLLAACGGGGSGGESNPGTVNSPPQIAGAPPNTAQAGQFYQFAPLAVDADSDTLTFNIVNRPEWATFSPSTGRLSGTPAVGDVGSYGSIIISVSDGEATVNLPAFAITVTATTSTADLAWTKPTKNEDGTVLTDLAGYRVRYGTSSGALLEIVDVMGADITSVSIEGLSSGTWYFSIASYTTAGVESSPTGTVKVALP